ncbi:preprotein translocase subunit SecG [Bartonella australis AUST/NH1]|uniref:Protein-export membrane protein SecG n=1 Tax=Bartonella australis (strain Aust/NH1) TaxID=1094489 RepID=M1NY22_BARAA|nr:preprotein translocase subunit SecG [Bartonella australis]AGF74372.1 preprotein translocase subunit SecG [Bartonella australis AUST/NH1]
MQTVLIVIHFLVVIALVGVVLMQPSEGGGLGAGSGTGFMRARGSKNLLTRLTAILAVCFFAISIGLVVVGNMLNPSSDILDRIPVGPEQKPGNAIIPKVTSSSDNGGKLSVPGKLDSAPAPFQEKNESAAPSAENPVPLPSEDRILDGNAE